MLYLNVSLMSADGFSKMSGDCIGVFNDIICLKMAEKVTIIKRNHKSQITVHN